MQVNELMSRPVVTISPAASLKAAARLMTEKSVSGLPVVSNGELVGIITEGDLVDTTATPHPRATRWWDSILRRTRTEPAPPAVSSAMTGHVITISPTATHTEAARMMVANDVKRLVVVDTEGRVIGVVSRSDIVRVMTTSDSEIVRRINEDVIRRILWLDPRTLSVASADGVVTLSGSVPTRTDRRLLAELTRGIEGVTEVDNRVHYEFDDTKAQAVAGPIEFPRTNW